MKKCLALLLLCFALKAANAQLTPFEQHKDKNYTATYAEIISYYQNNIWGL